MPRVGRVLLPNYPHHIVQRGHNRQVVFAEDGDFLRYVDDLRELKDAFGVKTGKGDRFIFHTLKLSLMSGLERLNKSVPFFAQHKNHLEVFDSKGRFRYVLNLDGEINASKTQAAVGRKIE
ncbi:transposase IS200 like family protein [Pseudomonas sp. TCU-HL1]|nr:transposase IS200 like family protein [Pseudomonas sp. TCU-HL1]